MAQPCSLAEAAGGAEDTDVPMEPEPPADAAAPAPLLSGNVVCAPFPQHVQSSSILSTAPILLNGRETKAIALSPHQLSSPRSKVSVAILSTSEVRLLCRDHLNWTLPNRWIALPPQPCDH